MSTSLAPGWTFVWGKTPETAKALIASAKAIGADPKAIRTTDNGFYVQDPVWDHAQQSLLPEQSTWAEPGAKF